MGLDGNDDAGMEMYQLGAPLFQKASVKLGEHLLVIVADNYSPEHIYVKRLFFNDQLVDRTWLKHSEIQNGGVLRFEMSKKPFFPTDDAD